jgi:hypothetical protein
VSADQVRAALENKRIKLVAQPHCGIDSMVAISESIGNIYVQMLWTVFHAGEGNFLTSDAPVIHRNPGLKGGFYGGGLVSQTAEVWFPLSRSACLVIRHDTDKLRRLDELLESNQMKEAEELRSELPAIREAELDSAGVRLVNIHTILKADRFVFSPYEWSEITRLLRGESQNIRVVVS